MYLGIYVGRWNGSFTRTQTHYYSNQDGTPLQNRIPGLRPWGESDVASRCKNHSRVFEPTGWQWSDHFTRTLAFKSSNCIAFHFRRFFGMQFLGKARKCSDIYISIWRVAQQKFLRIAQHFTSTQWTSRVTGNISNSYSTLSSTLDVRRRELGSQTLQLWPCCCIHGFAVWNLQGFNHIQTLTFSIQYRPWSGMLEMRIKQRFSWCELQLHELHPGAAWRNTIWSSLPWVQTPELTNCRGFDLKMLAADLLHIWYLGAGRDLLGSCLKILVQIRYFAGNSIEKSLGRASVRLRNFAKQNGLMLTLKKLTEQNLSWASDVYPEIKCKGYDTYIVLSWLVKEIEVDPPTSPVREVQDMLDEMCTALWSVDSWLRMLTHAPMHLTDSQLLQKTVLGNIFMTTYVSLAQRALVERKKLWRVRPKIHLLHHMVLEDRPSRLNPHYMSTWMDEDFIKRCMRVKKKTHKRQSTASTLSRWLLGVVAKLQEMLEQLRWKKCVIKLPIWEGFASASGIKGKGA